MPAVMRTQYWSVAVKGELTPKLLIYRSISVPPLTCGHELCVVNKKMDTASRNELALKHVWTESFGASTPPHLFYMDDGFLQ